MGEIDIILGQDPLTYDETVPEPETDKPAVNRDGDIWLIGPHRLICGDCLDQKTWTELLGTDKAQMVFTEGNVGLRRQLSTLTCWTFRC